VGEVDDPYRSTRGERRRRRRRNRLGWLAGIKKQLMVTTGVVGLAGVVGVLAGYCQGGGA